MFEKRTSFTDSLFYDISSWTLPLAFGIDYEEMKSVSAAGEKVTTATLPVGKRIGNKSEYAYVFESFGYYAPRAIYRLLSQGLILKVASDPFFHADGRRFERGAIMLPMTGQEKTQEQIEFILNEIATKDGIDIVAFNSGLDYKGVSLGSNSFLPLKKPVVAMLVGDGIAATDAGEVWHMLDFRFNIPLTLIPINVFERTQLNKYTTIIMPPTITGFSISEGTKEKLRAWVQAGGVVIGLENALNWLTTAGLGKFDMKKDEEKKEAQTPRPYGDIDEFTGAQETSGAIFEASVDLTHPLLYGYLTNRIPIFKSNNLFMEKSKGSYSNPIVFTAAPLVSGYMSKENYAKAKSSSVAGVTVLGQGRVIGFTDNLCFRAFWLGSNKILMNAIFYGPLINAASAR